MELLSEVIEKHTTMITVNIDMEDFNESKAEMLVKAFKQHTGKCPVRLKIRDWEEGHDLDLRSKNNRVNPAEFVKWLNETGKLKFTLNNKGVLED